MSSRLGAPTWSPNSSTRRSSAHAGELVQRPHRLAGHHGDEAAVALDAAVEGQLADSDAVGEAKADLGRRRIATEPVGRALGDDLAADDDRHPIGEDLGLVHVVGGEEDRLAQRPQVGDHVPGSAASRRVEPGRRLVEEEQLRVADQRQGDVEAALLAAGEPRHASLGLLLEADQADRLGDVARGAVVAGEQLERLPDGELGSHPGLLEDDPDPLAPVGGRLLGIDSEHRRLASGPLAVSLEHLDRGRLAGPVGAEEREHLAAVHLEIDAAHRLELSVGLAQPARADHRFGHRRAILGGVRRASALRPAV